ALVSSACRRATDRACRATSFAAPRSPVPAGIGGPYHRERTPGFVSAQRTLGRRPDQIDHALGGLAERRGAGSRIGQRALDAVREPDEGMTVPPYIVAFTVAMTGRAEPPPERLDPVP